MANVCLLQFCACSEVPYAIVVNFPVRCFIYKSPIDECLSNNVRIDYYKYDCIRIYS